MHRKWSASDAALHCTATTRFAGQGQKPFSKVPTLPIPKPDKTARLDIVSQVSLNEKEVQIWFQNRRQNDRRKSRPLFPQEIAVLRLGGLHAFSSDSPPSLIRSSISYPNGALSSSPPHLARNEPSTTPLSSPELGPWEPEALARKQAEEQQLLQRQERDHPFQSARNGAQTPSLSFSSSTSSVGYLANRWNAHSSFSTPSSTFHVNGFGSIGRDGCQDDLVKTDPFAPLSSAPAVLPPPHQQHQLRRPSQRPFRISLSLDGKAEVIAGLSPSPPRRLPPPQLTAAIPFGRRSGSRSSTGSDGHLPSLPAIQRAGLSRSQSAISLGSGLTLPPISSLTGSLESGSIPAPPSQPVHPPRLMRGRSRDVHAWVSVCNAEIRIDDELSAQAQHEISGSAIAAISLLRSTSANAGAASVSSSVLQPNSSKRNTTGRPTAPRLGGKRPKLVRSSSSVARLQSVPPSHGAKVGEENDEVWVDDEKKKKLKLSTLLSGNDSDKENWSPDEDGRPVSVHSQRPSGTGNSGRRPLPSARTAQQQRAIAGRVLNYCNINKNRDFRNSSNLLAKRQNGGKSGSGLSGGLDIFEDSSSEGGDAPTKRAPLSRAATIPGTDDVEKFMRSGEASPSKKGDLDCVAGLLSLSQGIWR
ncbi:homeobox transcription factor [Grosmannia clavigera kw1407]|uniref:Homeobox transcription factor n=1 Tax=Grosmannia clavigera (strain kw1407 / UAMH 11150) TaxID=655863 RepID=F0XHE1_GROCL|nr:homeobox transcription factor [Grosmannia clavigera kw1407]EFX03284.1 homeobox transcription factor [Grosmannia clavigera kw1407]